MNDADLRAELARRRVPHYLIAARVGLHPSVFALYTSGRRQISDSLERAILKALDEQQEAPAAVTAEASNTA